MTVHAIMRAALSLWRADAALLMLKRCNTEFGCHYEHIVSDDDSSMRKLLKHNKFGGELSDNVIQPKFLADPGHRIKCMTAPIFSLAYLPLKTSTCCKVHALRIKKYVGYYIKQYRKYGFEA